MGLPVLQAEQALRAQQALRARWVPQPVQRRQAHPQKGAPPHTEVPLREGLLRERGLLCMLGFRGALLLRNSTTGCGKGITLTKTTRRSSRNLLTCRNLRSNRRLRRKRASRGFLNRCLHCRLLRCFLGGTLRNRGNLPRAQRRIHARGLGGVCAGQRLTMATPRILTAARSICQRRRLSGLRGVC